MKRWMYWLLAVLALSILGGKGSTGTDVAKLQPVEVVYVARMDHQVQIKTDTGDRGMGENLQTAIANMQATAPAEIFLETAEYLLVDAEDLLGELMEVLRPSCRVCILKGDLELERVGAYLRIHQPGVTLRKYRAGMTDLQILKVTEGRMELVS